jgi:hypothetical protein
VAATGNALRVRATTRSLLPRECPARVEAALTATVPVVRVPQQVPVAPVPVVPVPQQVLVVPAPQQVPAAPVPVVPVPQEPVETVLLPA